MPHFLLMLVMLAGPTPAAGPNAQLQGWLMRAGKLTRKVDPDRLEQTLRRGEAVYLDGGTRSAAAILNALALDPSFWELAGTPVHDNLRYDLAGALIGQGAYAEARRILVDLLKRDPPSAFRAPAFRKLTDLTLQSEQFEESLTLLATLPKDLTRDEQDEVSYLKGKALGALGFTRQAQAALDQVSRHSRFRAAALYLLGVLELQAGRVEQAIQRFCSIVSQPSSERGEYTFFVSDKTLAILDHAWLALARLRHDRQDYQRAIDSYRQVAPDSPVYPLAAYESAWSLFRLGRFAAARRNLTGLLESNPTMADWPAARLLMGYALLSDCFFDRASQVFDQLEKSLGAPTTVRSDEIQAAVPALRREQAALDLAQGIDESSRRVLFLRTMLKRLASAMPQKVLMQPERALALEFERDLSRARGLTRLLVKLQAAATPAQLQEIRQIQQQVSQATRQAWYAGKKLQAGRLSAPGSDTSLVDDRDLPKNYLATEENQLGILGDRLISLGNRSLKLSNAARKSWNTRVLDKTTGWARAADIGKVDAVLGKKQALEIEVQNLAQGRYPMSLFTELARGGLVDETMEYWPYDGEDWPDEVQ